MLLIACGLTQHCLCTDRVDVLFPQSAVVDAITTDGALETYDSCSRLTCPRSHCLRHTGTGR